MPKRSPSYHFLRLVLSLPSSQRRLACRVGLKREVLNDYNELVAAPQFQGLPPVARQSWVRRQLCRHATGEDVGSNILGFHPFLLPAESWPRFPDLMLAEGAAPRSTMLPVVAQIGAPNFPKSISVGLHIHAFFTDGLEAVRDALKVNRSRPQLYVTGPERNREAVLQAFAGHRAPVEFIPCANVGRDVVPFLTTLPKMRADGHDLIGHIHIKVASNAGLRGLVKHWSHFLLSSLIGDPGSGQSSMDNIVADLASAAAKPSLYIPQLTEPLGWGANRAAATQLLRCLHRGPLPDRFLFSAGTMFWATPDYLRAFEALDLPWADVTPEPLPSDGTVLHAIERLFGALAAARGDRVVICPSSDRTFFLSTSLARRLEIEGYDGFN